MKAFGAAVEEEDAGAAPVLLPAAFFFSFLEAAADFLGPKMSSMVRLAEDGAAEAGGAAEEGAATDDRSVDLSSVLTIFFFCWEMIYKL